MEKWKPYPGNKNYAVSTLGRVKSLARVGKMPGANRKTDKIMQLTPCGRYMYAHFSENGHMHSHTVHRLVLETFVGPCLLGMETCHNDGNGLNNVLSNLRWDTRKNNHADKWKHGTQQVGEANGTSKYTSEQVANLLKLRTKLKVGAIKLSRLTGMPKTAIDNILYKGRWPHISRFKVSARMSESMVKHIRMLHKTMTAKSVANRLGIGYYNVWQIVTELTARKLRGFNPGR